MTQFSFTTIIRLLSPKKIIIYFDYFLPPVFAQWEDKYNGSIKIMDVVTSDEVIPLPSISIEAHIAMRRACWDYLEQNHLFHTHNVVSLPFYQ